jgi:hypothetical protein
VTIVVVLLRLLALQTLEAETTQDSHWTWQTNWILLQGRVLVLVLVLVQMQMQMQMQMRVIQIVRTLRS